MFVSCPLLSSSGRLKHQNFGRHPQSNAEAVEAVLAMPLCTQDKIKAFELGVTKIKGFLFDWSGQRDLYGATCILCKDKYLAFDL